MANVLGTLFGNIADAIRGKTGETGTMKPSEFPDKIAAIVTGGSVQSGTYSFKSGYFAVTGDSQTVEHGCGEVPDVVFVFPNSIPTAGCLVSAIGFSRAMHTALGGGSIGQTNFIIANGSGTTGYSASHGIEDTSSLSAQYGAIRDADALTFTVGGPTGKLAEESYYNYICLYKLA